MVEKLKFLQSQLAKDSRGNRAFTAYKGEELQYKTATMIGDLHPSENQESIVLISDIDSSLYDYKLMRMQNGSVKLVKTQVHIALRFFKNSNDDIIEKKKSLTKIQIDYLKKRI